MAASKYPGLRAGQLRDLVEIQERIEKFDGANAMLPPKWKTIGRAWADLGQLRGSRPSENVHANQLSTLTIFEVALRFRTDVTAKHRLRVLGPPAYILNIVSEPIDPDGRRRKVTMVCETGLVDG